jgi:hypothetical protein
MDRPNIFQIATKELSQDAFLTWMLKWAAPEQRENDPALHECARQFVVLLLREKADFQITSLDAGRQWNNVDVWAEINEETLLIIEDKKYATEHGNQLNTYREMAQEWCLHPDRNKPWKLVCVYLKTGNEAANDLTEIKKRHYDTIGRADLVKLFKQHTGIKNEIFTDFTRYLDALDKAVSGYLAKPWNKWDNGDWEGFYLWIDTQEEIRKIRWFWVNNYAGGFWAFLMNWEHENNPHPLYLQIESDRKMLCIKISTDEGGPDERPDDYIRDTRNEYYQFVMRKAKEAGLSHIQKPARFGKGTYMTVAVVKPEHWLGEPDQPVDFNEVKKKLDTYNSFVRQGAANWPASVAVAQ